MGSAVVQRRSTHYPRPPAGQYSWRVRSGPVKTLPSWWDRPLPVNRHNRQATIKTRRERISVIVDRSRALIFIPALDEAETIASVVAECLAICDVLVLDDGSSDTTSIEAKNAGASVIGNKRPGGYDRAIRTGFEYAVEHEFDILITADADGQHSGQDIRRALDDHPTSIPRWWLVPGTSSIEYRASLSGIAGLILGWLTRSAVSRHTA